MNRRPFAALALPVTAASMLARSVPAQTFDVGKFSTEAEAGEPTILDAEQ